MATLLWTIELNGRWIHNNLYVVPELKSIYYSDGAGCMLPDMRIRRLDLDSGKEISSYLTRAFVNSLSFSKDFSHLIANTDHQIISLSLDTLSERERWESQVPSGMTSTVILGRTLAMKDRDSGNAVNLYDLDTKKVQRTKVGEGGLTS